MMRGQDEPQPLEQNGESSGPSLGGLFALESSAHDALTPFSDNDAKLRRFSETSPELMRVRSEVHHEFRLMMRIRRRRIQDKFRELQSAMGLDPGEDSDISAAGGSDDGIRYTYSAQSSPARNPHPRTSTDCSDEYYSNFGAIPFTPLQPAAVPTMAGSPPSRSSNLPSFIEPRGNNFHDVSTAAVRVSPSRNGAEFSTAPVFSSANAASDDITSLSYRANRANDGEVIKDGASDEPIRRAEFGKVDQNAPFESSEDSLNDLKSSGSERERIMRAHRFGEQARKLREMERDMKLLKRSTEDELMQLKSRCEKLENKMAINKNARQALVMDDDETKNTLEPVSFIIL
ncbi:hypothetical protein HDU96_001354 [Phlyctochytrium bullatum]|nr:hypothetical protein HDU96_001354 [Phlyctochytrium bullatum]